MRTLAPASCDAGTVTAVFSGALRMDRAMGELGEPIRRAKPASTRHGRAFSAQRSAAHRAWSEALVMKGRWREL